MIWSYFALGLGFCLDLIFGDPHTIPHPVVFIGKLISLLERLSGLTLRWGWASVWI